MDEVDFTVLAATSVFTDLSEKCPPAEACRDAIDRTARATIRMANSTGGFGQFVKPRHSNSRGSISDHREWAQESDAASSNGGGHSRPPHPASRNSQQRYELPAITDAYSNVSSGAQLPPILQTAPPGPYRMNSHPSLKGEGGDGFSMMRNLPGQPRSNGSAHEATAGSPDASAIDPSLLPSPTGAMRTPAGGGVMVGSPTTTNMPGSARGGSMSRASVSAAQRHHHQQQQQQLSPGASAAQSMVAYLAQSQSSQQGAANAFSPSAVNFSDLQGMDFLQQVVGGGGGGGMNGGGGGGGVGMNGGGGPGIVGMDESGNIDLGMGLGWEGLHHDFSDGQQYDLFDGFFFGGQQGGGGGGMGGGSNGAL